MSKILQLPPDQAQKIAAGEVIERPANIVKELIENAIDAQATQITLTIEDGGKKLIHISDNGTGMSQDDARMCIKHHATSKIRTVHDLETLQTFGFRGEALSSIAAVSKLTIITKEKTSSTGISIELEDTVIKTEKTLSCNTGTEIFVRDLFYNIPARKKFLKTKETEWRAIVQLFYAFCFDYLPIHFKLYHDDRLVYNCPPTQNITNRLSQLYDVDLIQNILLISGTEPRLNLSLSGAISSSQYHRYDRNYIYIFVNKRWIKNYKLSQALIKGYQNMLPTGKFPAGFLFIELGPQYVDINIHPKKEEVQFLHPRLVEEAIESAVKKGLETQFEQNIGKKYSNPQTILDRSPKMNLSIERQAALSTISLNWLDKQQAQPAGAVSEKSKFLEIINQEFPTAQNITDKSMSANIKSPEIYASVDTTTAPKILVNNIPDYRLLGQTYLTYIIIESENGLVVIDQHAAHERIVYEQIRNRFELIESVKLLFPQIIRLSAQDLEIITPHLNIFTNFGIIIDQIGYQDLAVKETPVFLKNQALDDIIKEALSCLSENQNLEKSHFCQVIQEKVHAQLSCKAAIKAGDSLQIESMHKLITDLYSCENKLTCPHGRPTTWVLFATELEKKFKRDYR